MARASTYTLLSLDRYAEIMGLNPVAFNQARSSLVFTEEGCGAVTFQYAWQGADAVSREEIAREIAYAEKQVAEYLRWWTAPKWIAGDVQAYPRSFPAGSYGSGLDLRSMPKSIRARYGKVIAHGRRGLRWMGNAPVEYEDADGDGFAETAIVTLSVTDDDPELKVYFPGHSGQPEWEIRPPRSKTITAESVFTATFWAWQLIDPELWQALPTGNSDDLVVNLDDAASLITEVEVYREYNDQSRPTMIAHWTPLDAEWPITQDGVAYVEDSELGLLMPAPAIYDSTTGSWRPTCWQESREPEEIELYYYCGNLDQAEAVGLHWDGLSETLARIVARLATTRLRRPLCSCGSVGALVEYLQTDASSDEGGVRRIVLWQTLDNPFGTRLGELEAWHELSKLAEGSQYGTGAVA